MSVVALSGGIGGAKLALGLYRSLPPGKLTVIANTGDDFDHLGLHISPDVDTTLYTLSGLANPVLGWGRRDETWTFMETLERLGGETWFRLGDGDLALHVERTRRLAAGQTLSQVIAAMAQRLGITASILPMSDDPVRTRVATTEGELDFQEYFVRHQCRPVLTGMDYRGAPGARPAPAIAAALADPALEAVIICPSNPYLSIAPILAVPGLRDMLKKASAPVIAVSPLIGGKAVKGPTAKIMTELGIPVSPAAVTDYYGSLIDGFILDQRDASLADGLKSTVKLADTLMNTLEDRERLARECLAFAKELKRP
ncbi:2-phospho-L-lactate transferase [Denitratisoma oestradiolicum]|uniref:2-phospho-L-lactate transferase n=1 Tax=Denitratisoma oestradiolicum TaxID=311182 RepID=A0A6S6Y2V3_9PROT|nr:2-phospho-L-lactate transferase [Denitratisoma oestradiolicum]TWO78771.1 2-phospho-L-lactate transferase [Denitratisoma oestradiolicum]CAB1370865.1 2-phospho-L-lactate transferase [Denitratisoma oestradiolicum]